jgi:hypothetical protein
MKILKWSYLHTETCNHKVPTYTYRAIIDPSPPLHPASVSSPLTKREGGTHSPGGEGWGVNISEDARHWIGLLQYNPSTHATQSVVFALCTQAVLVDVQGHRRMAPDKHKKARRKYFFRSKSTKLEALTVPYCMNVIEWMAVLKYEK